MRRFALSTAAVLAAVFLWLLGTLPPRPAVAVGTVAEDVRRGTVAGAFHVHSTRSDGAEDVGAIAAAAARAGLRFVVMTDHGDATRPPDPPTYQHGVLVIDAVEISTNGGHYIALDMPAAPYPLGGEAAAVVEDVARLGGFGIVAHPDSAKPELMWKDWDLPVDGIEWLNLDSEWRDETRSRLVRVAIDYTFRKAPALASILDRPVATLQRWDDRAKHRRMPALPGHDAHGGPLEGRTSAFWQLPSYEASFRAFALRVLLDAELSSDATKDSRRLLDAIEAGRVFTAIDGLAAPAFVDFHVMSGGGVVQMGQATPFADGLALAVRTTVPPEGRVVLLLDGAEIATSASGALDVPARSPGAYRVEVQVPRAPGTPPIPWIVTNPIYLRAAEPDSHPVAADAADETVMEVSDSGRVEKDPLSNATLRGDDGRRVLEYRLREGERASQYAALAISMPPSPPDFDSLAFDAISSSPMRVSVQLRFDAVGGARWTHSVYVSPERKRIVVPIERLVSAAASSGPGLPGSDTRIPSPESASSILFVVDLTNARPGQQGRFEISHLTLNRR
jgi:hypothetical protein